MNWCIGAGILYGLPVGCSMAARRALSSGSLAQGFSVASVQWWCAQHQHAKHPSLKHCVSLTTASTVALCNLPLLLVTRARGRAHITELNMWWGVPLRGTGWGCLAHPLPFNKNWHECNLLGTHRGVEGRALLTHLEKVRWRRSYGTTSTGRMRVKEFRALDS